MTGDFIFGFASGVISLFGLVLVGALIGRFIAVGSDRDRDEAADSGLRTTSSPSSIPEAERLSAGG